MPRSLKSFAALLAAVVAMSSVLALSACARRTTSPREGEWRSYSGDLGNTRYSPLAQIAKENLEQLKVAWQWPFPDRDVQKLSPEYQPGHNEDTPLYANNVLYTLMQLGMIGAIDPGTGRTLWVYDPQTYRAGRPPVYGFINRGLAYWTDGTAERLFVGTLDAYLISIDAKTGKPDPAFGDGGKVDLIKDLPRAVRSKNFVGRRPFVAGDIVIAPNAVGDRSPNKDSNPPGYVFAFDVRTGKPQWTFHTIPQKGEAGYETWLEGSAEYSGATNVWGGIAYDPELGYVYMGTSTPNSDFYGGMRPGDNLFAESIVCLDAITGKRIWHFQGVHHGLWDYDFPAAPILGDFTVNGQPVKAVMQVSKQGFTYVLDRKTGKAVWPIEERQVPQSKVPTERTAMTQPFPTKPPAYERQGATEENLMDFTPALRKQAVETLQRFEHGPLFTPPALSDTLVVPGVFGAANWGGAGFDPGTGVLFVPSRMSMTIIRAVANDPARSNLPYTVAFSQDDQARIDGLPIFKPPYSRITAIDMNTGEHKWMTPLGNGPRNHPLLKDLELGPLGNEIQLAGVLITKTLVFVSTVNLAINGGPAEPPWAKWGDPDLARKTLFMFDKDSGKLLRVIEIPGGGAGPMTYLHNGKQYLVVATGGGAESALVAFAVEPSAAH